MTAVFRGARRRCPRCGRGSLFQGWYTLTDSCSECRLIYDPDQGDTWAFMYLSTGGLTGAIIVAMLLIQPASLSAGRVVVGLVAFVIIVGTLPYRKGVAIALDYLTKHEPAIDDGDAHVE